MPKFGNKFAVKVVVVLLLVAVIDVCCVIRRGDSNELSFVDTFAEMTELAAKILMFPLRPLFSLLRTVVISLLLRAVVRFTSLLGVIDDAEAVGDDGGPASVVGNDVVADKDLRSLLTVTADELFLVWLTNDESVDTVESLLVFLNRSSRYDTLVKW